MKSKTRLRRLVLAIMAVILLSPGPVGAGKGSAGKKKVLVVMSYHKGYAGEIEIARELEKNAPKAEFRYFYLNAKYDYEGGSRMGAEAYKIFEEYRPDAVVAVDDPAQHFFVVPFLRDRVKVPVVFCGVNFEAGKYHYPASNVTGVLEKKHYRESLGFARLVVPELRRVALIYKDNPTNRQNLVQIAAEEEDYPLEIIGKYPVESLTELQRIVARLEERVDGVMVLNLSGIVDPQGAALDGAEVLRRLIEMCRLPTIGTSFWEIQAGILCGVITSDAEQGSISAAMLKKIWGGTAVGVLPIMQNCNGLRLVNVATLKKLDLTLSPEAVLGTRLLKAGQD